MRQLATIIEPFIFVLSIYQTVCSETGARQRRGTHASLSKSAFADAAPPPCAVLPFSTRDVLRWRVTGRTAEAPPGSLNDDIRSIARLVLSLVAVEAPTCSRGRSGGCSIEVGIDLVMGASFSRSAGGGTVSVGALRSCSGS